MSSLTLKDDEISSGILFRIKLYIENIAFYVPQEKVKWMSKPKVWTPNNEYTGTFLSQFICNFNFDQINPKYVYYTQLLLWS